MTRRYLQTGFTLLELLVAVVLAAMLLAATSGIVSNALGTDDLVAERNTLLRDARFAMDRMTHAVGDARQLVLPLADKASTGWPEHIREQTVPASPPVGGSVLATAVLAVTLSDSVDLDGDGFADADNDNDGRIDEDPPADANNDFATGIYQIDDGGDGYVDNTFDQADDDEVLLTPPDEDPVDGVDNDGDGNVDEDPGSDLNGDGAPGIAGVDDDGDGQIDEGSNADDDEDGVSDEDWLDTVVYYLQGDSLIERHPVPWDETTNGSVTGRDFVVSVLAENVTRFRIERTSASSATGQLVDLTLELTGPGGQTVSLNTRVRIGGAL